MCWGWWQWQALNASVFLFFFWFANSTDFPFPRFCPSNVAASSFFSQHVGTPTTAFRIIRAKMVPHPITSCLQVSLTIHLMLPSFTHYLRSMQVSKLHSLSVRPSIQVNDNSIPGCEPDGHFCSSSWVFRWVWVSLPGRAHCRSRVRGWALEIFFCFFLCFVFEVGVSNVTCAMLTFFVLPTCLAISVG